MPGEHEEPDRRQGVMYLPRGRLERSWPACEIIADVDHRDRVGHAHPPVERNPMASTTTRTGTAKTQQASPPTWVKPELAALVKAAPDGPDWLHEIKMDGYRMHARLHRSATQRGALDAGRVNILTRRGNDWTAKYPAIAEAIARLPATNAYLDGELCGVLPDGRTAFNLIQNASDTGRGGSLVFFLFDLLFLNGEDITALPLIGPQGPAGETADRRAVVAPVQRSSDRPWPGLPSARLPTRPGRHRLEAQQWPVRTRPAHMAENEMPEPRGIRRGRLV